MEWKTGLHLMGFQPIGKNSGVKTIVLAETEGWELAGTNPPAESVAAYAEHRHDLRTRQVRRASAKLGNYSRGWCNVSINHPL